MENNAEGGQADFLRYTQEVWGRYAGEAISREDAREIYENMVAFFRILQRWESVKGNGSTGPEVPGR